MSRRRSARRRLSRDVRAPSIDLSMLRSARTLSRSVLLAGASALTLMLAMPVAHARSLGSAAVMSAPNFASDAATLAAQQAAAVAKQSSSALARATQAIQAMQAVQAAARSAAQARQTSVTAPTGVPNGLAPGGLQVAPGAAPGSALWQGANLPTQTGTNVNIQQTKAQAILNWTTFNVGAQTTVNFDQQGNSNWVALNRVVGSTAPSQILGNIKADGQVYVINQNGIIFGGSSQINVGSLIASSAGIADSQFLTHGIYSAQSGGSYLPSFTGAGGKIIVEQGALITTSAPTSVTSGGGFVLLMGTEVDNAGSITTPKGQAMLAAGDDFILRPGFGTAANQTSTTRGNEIAPVLYAGSTSGIVDNTGLMFSQQGDITLAGHAIVQDGILVSTTSVNQRGTIHLLNSASDTTGSVTLTGNSITLIMPELDSTTTALNSQRDALIADSSTQNTARSRLNLGQFDNLSTLADREDQSRIEIVTGGLVNFQNGSQTIAQGGQVSVSAGQRVFAETGSTIDVSGVQGVVLPMSSNQISINIQGNELRDSPQNRDSGVLLNKNVWIDVRDLILVPAGTGGYATDRYYTPGGLLEVSGYLNNTGHTIGEWTAVGGSITLAAPQVVAQQGSTFNISGGSVSYAGGNILSTNLRGSDGRIYSVDNAPANMTFTGLAGGFVRTHNINGQLDAALTEIWSSAFGKGSTSSRYEAGYVVGRDAGSIILSTPTSVFEGNIVADVITGTRQTTARPAGVTDGYKLSQNTAPLPGILALGQYNATGLFNAYSTDVVFGSNSAGVADSLSASGTVPADRTNTAYFNALQIDSFGLGGVKVATTDSISVDAPLSFAPGAQVKFVAAVVDIAANVSASSGSVTVTNIFKPDSSANITPIVLTTPAGLAQLTLEAGATIDTRGLWINALLDPGHLSGLAFVNGGSVSLDSTQGITLAAGSAIDTSSGGAILATGKAQGGKGGNVALVTNDDAPVGTVASAALVLAGDLRAYGVSAGGALTIAAPSVLIGDNVTAATPNQLVLPSSFFAKGFSNYTIIGDNGVTVAAGTQINVTEPVYRLNDASYTAPTGSDPAAALQVWLPPLYLANPLNDTLVQRAGASFALHGVAAGSTDAGGPVTIGTSAAITVDPLQSISIEAHGQITVDGVLTAHGGAISLINDRVLGSGSTDYNPNGLSIWIGDTGVLDVSGQATTATDIRGRVYGLVTSGGAILLGTNKTGFDSSSGVILSSDAFIIVRPGALLDASGTDATFNAGALFGTAATNSVNVASNGGSITMTSYDGIYADGTLRANAGGAGAAGGTLSVTLETPVYSGNNVADPLRVPRVITISQSADAPQLPATLQPGADDPSLLFGQARFSVDRLSAGGFDSLSFTGRDAILFDGNVNLRAGQSIAFYEGALADTQTNGQVTISAPYVLFGGATGVINNFGVYPSIQGALSSQQSTGTLSVAAHLIAFASDVRFGVSGSVTLNSGSSVTYDYAGFGNVDFTSQGDIRFLQGRETPLSTGVPGTTLLTSGYLSFAAAQLYPVTGATAQIAAGVSGTTLTTPSRPSGEPCLAVICISRINAIDPALPDSLFGHLEIAAVTINQGGIIRAPLGQILLGSANIPVGSIRVQGDALAVNLLAGSITSTSADGLIIPYGGTTDGVTYTYNGASVSIPTGVFNTAPNLGIELGASSVVVSKGAVIDVSGGGVLAGAGFISGRGGSVDVLTTPLVSANPANSYSASSNQVYAILPGYASGYAPVDAAAGAAPGIGQQITIPAGVPGLPAGTYTLLPARYALLPGGYRVELGKTGAPVVAGAGAVGNGSYLVSGALGVANTGIVGALPVRMVLTSGAGVRADSQYNETDYATFAVQAAATLGQTRPALPADAGILFFLYTGQPSTTAPALAFQGTALMQPAAGGNTGSVVIDGGGDLEVVASQATPGFSGFSFNVADLNAINASRLTIGGYESFGFGSSIASNANANSVTLRSGAVLSAGDVFLMAQGGGITLETGAGIDTLGKGVTSFNSANGYVYDAQGNAVLAVSNGDLNFIVSGQPPSSALITISAGAQIYSEGTIAFSTGGAVTIDPAARYGTRNLQLNVGTINVGSAASMAGANVPPGLLLSQDLLNRLMAGDTSTGAPALASLTLTASQSFNLYGSVDLSAIDPATGKARLSLVLNTPAIYGFGSASDIATLTVGTLTWGGILAQQTDPSTGATSNISGIPGAIVAGGPGTGSGTFNIVADNIVFGYPANQVPNNTVTLDRVIYGFSTVNLTATQQISGNNKNTLSVYQAQGTTPGAAGTGGNLNLLTPLLTGAAGSVMAYTAGGALNVAPLAGGAASPSTSGALGAEIDLNAATINVATAVVLPSGKLTMSANGDIMLQAGSRLDLAGQATPIFDQTAYSFGGNVILASAQGNIIQQTGSVIDVSAVNNAAGSIVVTAANGAALIDGQVLGSSSAGYTAGSLSVTAQMLGGSPSSLSADFAAFNAILNAGGVFGARSFDIKQGDLTIGDGVKAHSVAVSVDGGSLTVNGTIDASGAAPGTIRLAAKNNLTLASSGVLDAHGTVLQVDSYGAPIDAKNRATIELTATTGTMTLASGSAMNLTSPDGVARGQIDLNVARAGETSGDARIDASGVLSIMGAQSIAVNAFWTYSPTDQYGTIVQDNGTGTAGSPVSVATGFVGLNQIDTRSQTFMTAALANGSLLGRLTGLTAYANAFHLRPGVEIDGTPSAANPTGNLTVAGDLNLSGFRYGPNADRNPLSPTYGSGEPGALVIRAGGNLDIVGSISDGFAPAPATPDDNGWLLVPGVQTSSVETLLPIVLNGGTTFPNTAGLSLRYAIPINAATISAHVVIPVQVSLFDPYTVPAGTRLTAPVYDASGNLLYASGTVMAVDTVLPTGAQLGTGSVMPGTVDITAMTWSAGASLGVFTNAVTLSGSVTVPFEGIIPSGANLQMTNPNAPTRPTGTSGTQGSIAAIAAMLPQGDLSWSLRLVSGADLGAADTRTVKPLGALQASGASGNLTLTDSHVSSKTISGYFYLYNGVLTPTYLGGFGCTYHVCSFQTVTTVTGANPSVVRTGTGNLDLIAGGSFSEASLFGVYTAGTQSAPILAADGSNPYNLPRGVSSDGTLLGASFAGYNNASAGYKAWYPTRGGDVLISAQGNLTGYITSYNSTTNSMDSALVGNWLWRQGGAIAGQKTAWWINFGTYALPLNSGVFSTPVLTGFTGIGTLGGGNVTIDVGGNAGNISFAAPSATVATGLSVTVASTGRVLADGALVETGGGNLTVKIGGALNSYAAAGNDDAGGVFTDLRGNTVISAGSIGAIQLNYGGIPTGDVRSPNSLVVSRGAPIGGITVVPGDGIVDISTRGDLVLAGAGDAGRSLQQNSTPFSVTVGGVTTASTSGGYSWFTLWTGNTAIDLFSAGGSLVPSVQNSVNTQAGPSNDSSTDNGRFFFPASLSMVAASGDIFFTAGNSSLELAPAPRGQLSILAGGTIFGGGSTIDMSGADPSTMATPLDAAFAWYLGPFGNTANNLSPNSYAPANVDGLLTFGPDTPTSALHANDPAPARIYALGDIIGLNFGEVITYGANANPKTPATWYIGAKAADIEAGGDLISVGTPDNVTFSPFSTTTVPGFILNVNPTDISVMSAGRDIIYSSTQVAGPGLLDVTAGHNYYAGNQGTLQSLGPIFNIDPNNRGSGAGITVIAGVGAAGPDYTDFANTYLNPASALGLTGAGQIIQGYDNQLYTWLKQRFGYAGSEADGFAYFKTLNVEQQGVFLRKVYFDELNASGLEFNDSSSPRFKSYVRGRDAIAALFPSADAQGNPVSYAGNITMFGPSGIHTVSGGAIQTLTPGGETLIGVEGVNPPGSAGLLTQGSGDIDVYSLDSILLGQSRIMTTFGGDIVAWTAEGDINAGRGSKTTVVFTPPQRVYDNYGNVSLSPQVPSTGAGIAALNPIPSVPRGNINLVAPLGTIDAGEAGIRSSGNVNLAALQIVNAANITAQGTTTGVPVVQAPNISGALAASNATAATQQTGLPAQSSGSDQPSIIVVEFLGFGGSQGTDDDEARRRQQ